MFIFRYNRVNKLGKKFLYKFDLEIEQIKVLNQVNKLSVYVKKVFKKQLFHSRFNYYWGYFNCSYCKQFYIKDKIL